MNFFFETYGCQMNKAESSSIEQVLLARGWTSSPDAENADLIVINTCSVRATAETRIHGRLGWYTALRKARPSNGTHPFTLVVTGCMAERLQETLKHDFPVVDFVVGTFQKSHFDVIAEAVEKSSRTVTLDEDPVYSFAPLSYENGEFRAFVPIMHGCNNFCTYCIVPYVRGREVSRDPAEILREIDVLSAAGVKEITLLGQNVNSYTWPGGVPGKSVVTAAGGVPGKSVVTAAGGVPGKSVVTAAGGVPLDFAGLMQLIADHIRDTGSGIGWVRFMSSHPKDLSDALIDVIKRERVICRHIHLPVQHGSSKILASMNRKYTRESYLDLVSRIRSAVSDVSLTTDVLLGFPAETEEDFAETVSLMEEVRYTASYMYYYNPREGTAACSFPDQVPMEIKKRRLAKIIDLQQAVTKQEMKKRIGTVVTVLAETVSRDSPDEILGRTEQDERVVFAGSESIIGSFVRVKLSELTGNTFRGIIEK